MTLFSRPREMRELDRDESGQLTVEWILLNTGIILPFLMFIPGSIDMLRLYFYRIASVISCPFP